jgi:hypothetical protein
MKPLILFFIVFASLSANLGDSLLGRLGLKADYLSAGLTSLLCAVLVIGRPRVVIIAASILAVLASLPETVTGNIIGNVIDRDYLYGLFIAVLIAPYLADFIE